MSGFICTVHIELVLCLVFQALFANFTINITLDDFFYINE